jgi:hypothetical protein
MFQSSTLIQNLNDSQLAERRREVQSHRSTAVRHGAAHRVGRPLARLISR